MSTSSHQKLAWTAYVILEGGQLTCNLESGSSAPLFLSSATCVAAGREAAAFTCCSSSRTCTTIGLSAKHHCL